MKNIVIFDLDGTLANTEECRHYLEGEKKDWDGFYHAACEVSKVEAVTTVLNSLRNQGFEIVIASGRSDIVRQKTKNWLNKHGIFYDQLFMRPAKDHTPDDKLKRSWIESGYINKDKVLCVFEDRNRMVKMWREIGIPCFQVAEGDF